MMNLIVSDTTTLIILERLDALSMLCSLFDQILIPQAVMDELLEGNSKINELMQLSGCYKVVSVNTSERLLALSQWLDKGEAEAIELALIRQLPLIIDERKGRKIARQKKLWIIGLAGLIVLAAKRQQKTPKVALALLDQAMLSGYRLSTPLYQQVKEALLEIENEMI
jgi:predicted nucleic acid-binding protein